LKETTSGEEEAKGAFATLMSSEEQEIVAVGNEVEEKTGRIGELVVSAV